MDKIPVLDKGWVILEDFLGGDQAVVEAARICYQSEPDDLGPRDRRLIKRLITSNPPHTTPLEHAVLRFRIKCPLFVRDHLVRHRIASWNIKSLRYCVEDKEYYIPDGTGMAITVYVAHLENSFRAYESLLERGWPREQARMVLPTAVYTECLLTLNCSSFINLLNKRTHKAAQAETREYARAMYTLWFEVMPITASAWAEHTGYYE